MEKFILILLFPLVAFGQSGEILSPKDSITGNERIMLQETDSAGNRRTVYTGQLSFPCNCEIPEIDTLTVHYSGIARPQAASDGSTEWVWIQDNAHYGPEFLKPIITTTPTTIQLEFDEQIDLIKSGWVDPDGLLEQWEFDLSINSSIVSIGIWRLKTPVYSFLARKIGGNWSIVSNLECPYDENAGCNGFESVTFTETGNVLRIDYANHTYSGFGGSIVQENGPMMFIRKNYVGAANVSQRDEYAFFDTDGVSVNSIPDGTWIMVEKRCEDCPMKKYREDPRDVKFQIPLSNIWIGGRVVKNE